jgi:hypothetical protein
MNLTEGKIMKGKNLFTKELHFKQSHSKHILKHKIQIELHCYTTRDNAFDMIQSKSQTNKYTKSGIYKINCSDCNRYYIGQTGRNFQTRFKEHIQALKSHYRTSQKSAFLC